MLRRLSTMSAVAEQQKSYEAAAGSVLRSDQPIIVRLDGHRFSSFTKGFHKPYDWRIFRAMQLVGADLMGQLGPSAVYTQSDEMSVVWPRPDEARGQGPPFAGKTFKLATLTAALASVRFGVHLAALLGGGGEREAELRRKTEWAHFDGRAFNVPGAAAVVENLAWRQADARRNSVNSLGAMYFNNSELLGRSPAQVRAMLEKGPRVNWHDMHPHFRQGALLKKQHYARPFVNPQTGQEGLIERSRVAVSHLLLSERDQDMLLAARVAADDSSFAGLEEEGDEGGQGVDTTFQPVTAVAAPPDLLPPACRLARHLAAFHVARVERAGPGVLVVAGSEDDTDRALAEGASRVVLVADGAGRLAGDRRVLCVAGLAWLRPEQVGLPSYESHDEGLRDWRSGLR